MTLHYPSTAALALASCESVTSLNAPEDVAHVRGSDNTHILSYDGDASPDAVYGYDTIEVYNASDATATIQVVEFLLDGGDGTVGGGPQARHVTKGDFVDSRPNDTGGKYIRCTKNPEAVCNSSDGVLIDEFAKTEG